MTSIFAWRKSRWGIDWNLIHNGESIASLKSENWLGSHFKANYGSRQMEINQRKKSQGFIFKDLKSDVFMGSIDMPFLSTIFSYNNGKEYQIEWEKGLWYFKDDARRLGVTKYSSGGFEGPSAEFSKLDFRDGDPELCLIAISTLLVAVLDSHLSVV